MLLTYMELKQQNTNTLKTALFFLHEYENKSEIRPNIRDPIIISDEARLKADQAIKEFLAGYDKENYAKFLSEAKDDKELLREITKNTLSLLDNDIDFMRELKEKYF